MGHQIKTNNFGNKSVSKKDSRSGNNIELTDSEDELSDLLPTKKKHDTGSSK